MGSETKMDDGGMTGEWLLIRCADGRVMGDFEREADARVCERDCNADPDDDSLYIVARRATPTPSADGELSRDDAEDIVRESIPERVGEWDDLSQMERDVSVSFVQAGYRAALRARPLPDDVRAAVERVRSALARHDARVRGGSMRETRCVVTADALDVADLRTLLAHLQRNAEAPRDA